MSVSHQCTTHSPAKQGRKEQLKTCDFAPPAALIVMARCYKVYAADINAWLACFGSKNLSLLEQIRFAAKDREELETLLLSAPKGTKGKQESSTARYFSEQLLQLGCPLRAAPKSDLFLFGLSQMTLVDAPRGTFAIDREPYARTAAEKLVATYLGKGRPISGKPDRQNAYGYLKSDAELRAFTAIVHSTAWERYTAPARYTVASAASFHRQRQNFLEWLDGVREGKLGIYFCTYPVRIQRTAKRTVSTPA